MIITGIGSRKTPEDILVIMESVGRYMKKRGHGIRSGHAPGADYAFEKGAGDNTIVYLPWRGFNSEVMYLTTQKILPEEAHPAAKRRALEAFVKLHPSHGNTSEAVKKFMIRNYYQVMGCDEEEKYTSFVVCWTPGGRGGGGTGQAIRIAMSRNIPVWDMGKREHLKIIVKNMVHQGDCYCYESPGCFNCKLGKALKNLGLSS